MCKLNKLKKTNLALLFWLLTLLPISSGWSDTSTLNTKYGGQTLDILIETIENAEQRQRFLENLIIIKKQMEQQQGTALDLTRAVKDQNSNKVSMLDQKLFEKARHQTDRFFSALAAFGENTSDLVKLPEWLYLQYIDPKKRAFWLELGFYGAAFPIVVAIIAHWFVTLFFRPTIRRLRETNLGTIQGRFITGITTGILDAVSVGAVLALGYIVLGIIVRSPHATEIARIIINAIALIGGIGVVSRLILAPYADALRPVPLAAATSAYLYIWVRRLALFGVVGYTFSKILSLIASLGVAAIVEVLSAAVFSVLLAILVLQSKEQFATVVRGRGTSQIRKHLAEIWHVLALVYIFLVFCVFSSGAQNGFMFLVKSTGITVFLVIAGGLLSLIIRRSIDRVFRIDPELDERFPGLLKRSSLYRPVLRKAVDAVILVSVLLMILAGWEVNLFSAISVELRGQIMKSVGTIFLVVIVCVVAWEFSSSFISKMLVKSEDAGSDLRIGSRSRTLLPLLRRAILIALFIFGSLIVLAEIGVDIAPLLAGAGVIGLAIGFGSQALVRDIITGLFILIEDTIAVGDVVTVGGHTGLVEDLSIRTIRLRDVAGTVHTVPFGDVTTVENLTKDFSYALLDIGIAYREDTDAVSEILKEICASLQSDEIWGDKILEPIQVMGVQELADSAVIIRSRIKTEPIMQWAVKREFLRLVKKRFDQEGIELPFPHTTVYFGEDQDGKAPPARILIGDALASKEKDSYK
tara:strand:+ start:130 stop:2382 length:2253 start_codon:yes stop_codon:yes gene_type:complete